MVPQDRVLGPLSATPRNICRWLGGFGAELKEGRSEKRLALWDATGDGHPIQPNLPTSQPTPVWAETIDQKVHFGKEPGSFTKARSKKLRRVGALHVLIGT